MAPQSGKLSQAHDHSNPDTLSILIATDNHVGFAETDPIRGDDSWRTFDEILTIAKERDVDMVLLGGDLFHYHTPSRKSMLHVIRSLRRNCLGDKPCELEFLSDGTELFGGLFNTVNYEDPNINVAIPVFSIHGNHDEPTGHEFYAALDVLQETGLINYFGRMNKNDKIEVKPLLLQKGRSKLSIFGLSNLRDERLFREFRGGRVKFFRPSQQRDEWFNLMVVHQNHHSRTPTGYLPESFLPNFLDLVIWGHEHDCEIEPRYVEEQGFHVIQPGSSVATQLTKGETIPKHVAILKVKGKNFQIEPIRLKTVRPFIFKEIILAEEKDLKNVWKKTNNRNEISRHLKKVIKDMVDQANQDWLSQQTETDLASMEDPAPPRPLVRLRVDYTAPEGGQFDIENSQRITSDFMKTIANHDDVIVFHTKKRSARRGQVKDIDIPQQYLDGGTYEDEEEIQNIDGEQMGKLVREFLEAQSLTVLPQNVFGDAVTQYVDKDDRDAMVQFVTESMGSQVAHMLNEDSFTDDVEFLREAMEQYRIEKEKLFEQSGGRRTGGSSAAAGRKSKKLNSRPEDYDSEEEGPWEDNPDALMDDDDNDVEMVSETPPTTTANKSTVSTRGRGRGRGRAASTTSRASIAKIGTTRGARSRAVVDEEEEEENESDVNMQLGSNPEDESQSQNLFVSTRKAATASGRAPAAKKPPVKATTRSSKPSAAAKTGVGASMRQSTLDFASQPTATRVSPRSSRSAAKKAPVIELSSDEIEDDEDAFEPMPPKRTGRR